MYTPQDFSTNAYLAQQGSTHVSSIAQPGVVASTPVAAATGHGLISPVVGPGLLASVGTHQLVSSTAANLLSAAGNAAAQQMPPAGYPQICAPTVQTAVSPPYQPQRYHHHHHHQSQTLHHYPVASQQYALPALPTGSPVLRVTLGADTTHGGHSSQVHTPTTVRDVNIDVLVMTFQLVDNELGNSCIGSHGLSGCAHRRSCW